MRRWMFHGNISRKGYRNALIGRYGGCYEEGYKEVDDDRAYRAKGLDYRRRWMLTLGVRRKQCTAHERLEKYGKVQVSTFEHSHYSEELMHLLSVTLSLIRRFKKRQV